MSIKDNGIQNKPGQERRRQSIISVLLPEHMANTVHVLFRAEVPLEHVTEQADH